MIVHVTQHQVAKKVQSHTQPQMVQTHVHQQQWSSSRTQTTQDTHTIAPTQLLGLHVFKYFLGFAYC